MPPVDPARVPGDHDQFTRGNHAAAKAAVAEYLREWFGWRSIADVGDIRAARGMEMILPPRVRLKLAPDTPLLTFHVQR
jgi:predicted dinucleotide-binding enzyme